MRWQGLGACEGGVDGDEDKDEEGSRRCGAGDTRKKTEEKAHGRKRCFWDGETEGLKRKAESEENFLNLAKTQN